MPAASDIPDYGGLQCPGGLKSTAQSAKDTGLKLQVPLCPRYSFTLDEMSNKLTWTCNDWAVTAEGPPCAVNTQMAQGCGKDIYWSEMEPITEQEAHELGMKLCDLSQAVWSTAMSCEQSSLDSLPRIAGPKRLVALIQAVMAQNRPVNLEP